MDSRLTIALVGRVGVRREGRPLALSLKKSLATLVVLALSAPSAVAREKIMALLWSESDPQAARAGLRQALHQLRREFGPDAPAVLRADSDALALTAVATDVGEAMAEARQGSVPALLEGRPTAFLDIAEGLDSVDEGFATWIPSQRQRLHEEALELLFAALADHEPPDPTGARIARLLLRMEPTHEVACRFLMRTHSVRGNIAAALSVYNELWEHLDREFDTLPSEETQRLIVTIKQGDLGAGATETKPAPPPPQSAGTPTPRGASPQPAAGTDARRPDQPPQAPALPRAPPENLAAEFGSDNPDAPQARFVDMPGAVAVANLEFPVALSAGSGAAPGFRPIRGRVPGRGTAVGVLVLLMASILAAWLMLEPQASESLGHRPGPRSEMPSVAVRPFQSLGGSAAQEALVVSVTRDMIADLSKFSGLFVIAADTSFRFAALPLSGTSSGGGGIPVRYTVNGSVQWGLGSDGSMVRVNASIIENETGRHVWAEHYDRPAGDLLKLQNEIARRVVDVIGPVSAAQGRLRQAELDRLARIPTENLQAYDHYLKGVVHFERFIPEENLLARQSFARAVALDPGYAKPYAMAVWTYLTDVWNGNTDTPDVLLAEAEGLAERAIAADPGEAYAYWALGALRLFQRRHDESIAAYRQAVELNPNGADLLVYLGWALAYAGDPDEGLTYMDQAIERNPYHPGWYLYDVAWGHFVAHRYEAAIDALNRRHPKTTGTHELLALCYAMLGRDADAMREMKIVLERKPHFTVELAATLEPFAHAEDLQHYLRALRAAGVPEHSGG